MQLPGSSLQFIKNIPVYGQRLFELFQSVQQQTTTIEKQGNLNATGAPPVPPPPDALNVTNGPSGEYQIAVTHNGEFNRGTNFHVQWDTSPHFTNPHNIDLGASRNDSSLYLPGQTAFFRAAASSPSGANSAWTYHGSQNQPKPVIGGVRGVRAPGMGSGTGAPGDQSGGPGPIQSRNPDCGYDYKAQQRTAGAGFGAAAQGSPAGVGASDISGGGGGGGGGVSLSEATIAPCEALTSVAGTNTITAVTAVAYSALAAGFKVRLIPANTNAGAVTLNVNSIGAKAVTKNGTTALTGGELQSGREYDLNYDGTQFQIIGPSLPISALVIGSDASGNPSAAILADTKVWIGSGGNLPVAQSISGDAQLADTGVLTLATVNGFPGSYGDSTHVAAFLVNAKGLVTVASPVAIATAWPSWTLTPSTVALLPGTPTKGQMASVNNALAPVVGAAVVGGGAAFAAVCWNGSQWSVFST